jgi:hypothetical protein
MPAVMRDDWFNLTRAARLQIPIEPVLGTDSLFQGCQQAGPGVTWLSSALVISVCVAAAHDFDDGSEHD